MRKLIGELTINTNSEADSEIFEILLKVSPHNYTGKFKN